MRKIKAIIYAILGGILCWNTYKQGHYNMTAGIAFFTGCAIFITLAGLGKRSISWDEKGVTLKKFPSAPTEIRWAELEKMKVDHLGYHVKAKNANFTVSRAKMPASLLSRIRESIQQNNQSDG